MMATIFLSKFYVRESFMIHETHVEVITATRPSEAQNPISPAGGTPNRHTRHTDDPPIGRSAIQQV
jgi:hypothetical protein